MNLAALSHLINSGPPNVDSLKWLLENLPGGMSLDGIAFRFLTLELERQTLYVRERELSHFTIELWGENLDCIAGRGEIPFLYRFTVPDIPRSTGTAQTNAAALQKWERTAIPRLVDFIFQTTGGGIGVEEVLRRPISGRHQDSRTGAQVRYTDRLLGENVFWVQPVRGGEPVPHRRIEPHE